MALGFSTALRNSRLDAIVTFAGNGALLRVYSGTRPATGGTVTTLLGELVCGSPFATVSNGVLTLNTVAPDSSADGSGSITWFRIVKADGTTHVMDGSCATIGSDITWSSNGVSGAATVISVNGLTITEANA
jgi:hypothetical protein